MKELIEVGLVGAGRVNVRTPTLVSRYNEALERIGVEPTALLSFSIDGIGWSPEVAQEKKNPLYLFQGEANRCAVILCPDQRNKPIYFPYASYERDLMRAYFSRYWEQIVDITTSHPMILILDQEITRYETPFDLVLDCVVVKTDTEGLAEAAAAQKAQIVELVDGEKWMDAERCRALAASAKEHGDLRFRNTQVADFRFDNCQCFFTEAFGGVYVLRDAQDLLLVLEDPKCARLTPGEPREHTRIIAQNDPALPALLVSAGYAEIDFARYAEHPELLSDIRNCLVASLVTEEIPNLTSYLRLPEGKKKRLLADVPSEKTHLLSALERLQRSLARNGANSQGNGPGLDRELALLLMVPVSRNHSTRRDPRIETVSMLLARLRSHDPLELYRADKNSFVQRFPSWSAAYREWATARIKERYEPVMNQPDN